MKSRKRIIVGQPVLRFMYDSFDQHYQATIGIDFLSKTLQIDDNTVRLQVKLSFFTFYHLRLGMYVSKHTCKHSCATILNIKI